MKNQSLKSIDLSKNYCEDINYFKSAKQSGFLVNKSRNENTNYESVLILTRYSILQTHSTNVRTENYQIHKK